MKRTTQFSVPQKHRTHPNFEASSSSKTASENHDDFSSLARLIEPATTRVADSARLLQHLPNPGARQQVFRSLAANRSNSFVTQVARSTKKSATQTLDLSHQMASLQEWFGKDIDEASQKFGVGAEELSGIIATEVRGELSKGNKEAMATASSGAAFGVMQLTKGTWKDVQNTHKDLKDYDFDSNWKDPHVNILFGAATLYNKKRSLHSKNILGKDATVTDEMAFVAYNAGEGTVSAAYKLAKAGGSEHPETDYLKPEYLKPAIKQTGIYSYYVQHLKQTEEQAIESKYQEVTKYPELAKARIEAMEKNSAASPEHQPAPAPAPEVKEAAVKATVAQTSNQPAETAQAANAAILSVQEEQLAIAAMQKASAEGKRSTAIVDSGYFAIRPHGEIKPGDSKAIAEWKFIHSTLLPQLKSDQPKAVASVVQEQVPSQPDYAAMLNLQHPTHLPEGSATQASVPVQAPHPAAINLQHPSSLPEIPAQSSANQAAEDAPDALDKLMNYSTMTPHYTAAQIHTARDLIVQEKDTAKRNELYMLLQAKVEYHNQRNNASTGGTDFDATKNRTGKKIGDVMCNLTSLAMALETLGIGNPDPEKYPQYEDYLEHEGREKLGAAFDRTSDWDQVASAMGAQVTYLDDGKGNHKKDWWLSNALPHLREGNGMMFSIDGHILRLQDVTDTGLIVDDPFGKVTLKAGKDWSYDNSNMNSKERETGAGVIGENSLWKWQQVEVHTMKWVGVVSKSKPKNKSKKK